MYRSYKWGDIKYYIPPTMGAGTGGGLGVCNPPWQNNGGVLIPKTPPAI